MVGVWEALFFVPPEISSTSDMCVRTMELEWRDAETEGVWGLRCLYILVTERRKMADGYVEF